MRGLGGRAARRAVVEAERGAVLLEHLLQLALRDAQLALARWLGLGLGLGLGLRFGLGLGLGLGLVLGLVHLDLLPCEGALDRDVGLLGGRRQAGGGGGLLRLG